MRSPKRKMQLFTQRVEFLDQVINDGKIKVSNSTVNTTLARLKVHTIMG